MNVPVRVPSAAGSASSAGRVQHERLRLEAVELVASLGVMNIVRANSAW